MDGSEDNAAYDDMLLEIIKREGKIDSFISIFFGFLQRNTDFFRIMADPSAKFGFPPGVARAKIWDQMTYFEDRSFQLYPDDKKLVEEAVRVAKSEKKTASSAAAAAPTTTTTNPAVLQTQSKQSALSNDSRERGDASVVTPQVNSSSLPAVETQKAPSNAITSSSDANVPQSVHVAPAVPATFDPTSADSTPALEREETVASSDFQNNPDTYNGAARDNYAWGQTIKDLDLRVRVDKDVKKAKQLRVDVKDSHVKVQVQKGGSFKTLVDGALKWKVHSADSVWTLIPGDHVHINLDKVQERWWESCFQDEPEIQLKSIDCSRPLEELDDESLATVNKLKFDQMQKEMGKPTSDQLKIMDQLKDGWNADGSPFKGQPFDPSVLDFGQS